VREGYPDRVVIPRGWQIHPEYVAATKLRYRTARVIHNTVDGIKTRNRVRFDGIPKWDAPAFAASGLMAVSLRGWHEKKRSYTLPKTEQRTMEVVVDVEAGFSLQVDPKRSGCAVNIAGLNASAMADLVTSSNCPITDRLMDEIVEWQGHQDTLKKIIGYSRLAAQGMRWIGGL
jgi:hypothetical protein